MMKVARSRLHGKPLETKKNAGFSSGGAAPYLETCVGALSPSTHTNALKSSLEKKISSLFRE